MSKYQYCVEIHKYLLFVFFYGLGWVTVDDRVFEASLMHLAAATRVSSLMPWTVNRVVKTDQHVIVHQDFSADVNMRGCRGT